MMHIPVLLHEAIDGLDIKVGNIFVDGTLGNGGHSEEVCKRFGNKVSIVAIDLDSEAIERSKEKLSPLSDKIHYVEGSFRSIDIILDRLSIEKVDRILFDIGLSSNQFEESGRGFSFQRDEPLLMSFKSNLDENDLTAREIINDWDEESIRMILEGYGEEQFARRIAKAIVIQREMKPIETTGELVETILSATPRFYHHRKIHPATKTFQALRITVNDEIRNLKDGISKGFKRLNKGGRLAVISFHSLEDRVVKNFSKEKEVEKEGKKTTKKPIIPKKEEIETSPRSRSAKLRIIEKL